MSDILDTERQETLAKEHESLQKQKIEGFHEYFNDLNSLNSKQFAKFLVTSSQVKPFMRDLKNFMRDGIKPYHALKEIIDFFSNEGDLVLDVFSGSGENLKMLSDMNRVCTGIEKDTKKVEAYKNSVLEDSFLEEAVIIEKDALQAVSELSAKYDFILLDPPVKTQKSELKAENIGDLPILEYILYIKNVIESLKDNLNNGKYLVCLMQDFYFKGEYYMLPALVASEVKSLKFKGIKIYSRQLDINNIPNKKVYAPVQNHFYALIFTI